MGIRPHSISELAHFAKDDSPPASRSIKEWLRVADALRQKGYQSKDEGDFQAGFLYLARSATYILEKIPHHSSYHELTQSQMQHLKHNGQEILQSLEQLKPKLADRYEQWLAKDPANINAPSQLEAIYGQSISPVIPSRSKQQRQDSGGSAHTRTAVSQQSKVSPVDPIDKLGRDLSGLAIRQNSLEERRQAEERNRRANEEAVRREWQKQQENERLLREQQRAIADRTKAQTTLTMQGATLAAARQAAGQIPPERQMPRILYDNQRPREDVARAPIQSSVVRHVPHYDTPNYQEGSVLPHLPLQDPTLFRAMPSSSAPIWESLHTPPNPHHGPIYAAQMMPRPAIPIQYPSLMNSHQREQGYKPSIRRPSSSGRAQQPVSNLYNIPLAQPQQMKPTYTPAPPPPRTVYATDPTLTPGGTLYTEDGIIPQRPQPYNPPSKKSELVVPPDIGGDLQGSLRPIDIPSTVMDEFVAVARVNTNKKKETCGLLLGKAWPADDGFTISTLLIPEQRSTQDTCTMEGEELVLEFQTGRELLTLGWIHTHPTQSCFMSSLDLHTHSGYQRMLQEAIAIVCAPNSDPKCGIFRLTDPPGLETILSCDAKEAFHPHPDLPIYTDADGSHVRMVQGMHLEIVDLRQRRDLSSSEGTRGV